MSKARENLVQQPSDSENNLVSKTVMVHNQGKATMTGHQQLHQLGYLHEWLWPEAKTPVMEV